MWDYIANNKEWIFSGIGVFCLTLIIGIFFRKKRKTNTTSFAKQNINDNTLNDSTLNNIKGDKINFNQTIFNTNPETKSTSNDDPLTPIIESPLLTKSKQDYYTEKKRLRTFIYALISPAKNLNKIIEIRNVTDSAEEIVNVDFKVILQELKEMEEEKLIELNNDNGDNKLESPYTRIKLTKKFFSTIKDSS